MKKPSPVEQVEAYLHNEHQCNLEHSIYPSKNAVIDRLLTDRLNMADVYTELLEKCNPGNHQDMTCPRWHIVMDAIISTAAFLNPHRTVRLRADMRTAIELNQNIKMKAGELAKLLRQRGDICEKAGFSSTPDYHPLDLLEPATKVADRMNSLLQTHALYKSYVKKEIEALGNRYDLKYWPRTADMIDALAEMQDIDPTPAYSVMAAALSSDQASFRDFWRGLDAELSGLNHYGVQVNFSDAALAAITNCTLGLDAEITPSRVKKFRADERKKNR